MLGVSKLPLYLLLSINSLRANLLFYAIDHLELQGDTEYLSCWSVVRSLAAFLEPHLFTGPIHVDTDFLRNILYDLEPLIE